MVTQEQVLPLFVSEHVVLEGYRSWCFGVMERDPWFVDKISKMCVSNLGKRKGKLLEVALTEFMRTIGHCAGCTLKTNSPGSFSLCQDEILILGLISGLQHADEAVTTLCLDKLTCPTRCNEVLYAAETLSVTLRSVGNMLLPISIVTIRSVLTYDGSTSTLQ